MGHFGKLAGSFGSSDNGGERQVLTLTVDSFGHLAKVCEQPLTSHQIHEIG